MNLRPPPPTDNLEELRQWCEDLYEFLKTPVFREALFMQPTSSQTGNYTLTARDGFLLANAASGLLVWDVPSAVGLRGRPYSVKKADSSANPVRLKPYGSQKIEDNDRLDLTLEGEAVTIVSDGANWRVFMAYQPSADIVNGIRSLEEMAFLQLMVLRKIELHESIQTQTEIKDDDVDDK